MADGDNQTPNDGDKGGESQPVTSIAIADLKTAGIPETYFGQDGAINAKDLGAHLGEYATMKSAADERAKAVPQDGNYDFGLPKDWQAPEGVTVSKETLDSWSISDGRKAVFAEYAKTNNLSQAEVSGLISKLAAADITEKLADAKAITEAHTAEMGKLGEKASARLEAIDSYLKQNVGNDAAVALTRELTTAASIEAVEKLINAANGSKQSDNQHRNGADRPAYETLTPSQLHRMAHTAKRN